MHRRDQGSLLANYNSLRDEHLSAFNSDPKRLRHFKQMGLISEDNVILNEKRVRENLVRRQQQKQANGMLADSVVSRAIDLERKRRIDIKKKLEFLDKIEKVERVKNMRHHPLGIQDFDPYETTPHGSPDADKFMKDLERRKGKLSGYTASDYRIVPGRSQSPYMDIRILTKSLGIPIVKPRPPSAPRPTQSAKARRGVTMRRVQTIPFTIPKPSVYHTNTQITLCYVGRSVSLNGYRSFEGSEVMVVQQHCGGNTLTLYRGNVKPKETFQFVSKRHVGSPFGLTIYLDGLMDVRVSGCCEYRHGVGKMLGRTIAHFKVVKIEGGSPCFRCKDAQDGRPRSVMARTSQASSRIGRLESKSSKIVPIRDGEIPEGASKKKPSKGTPKSTPTKSPSKVPSGSPKKTKKKKVSRKSLKDSSEAFNQPKTEMSNGHLEHEGSDGSSIYEYSSDSAEEPVAGNDVIEAVSSDEMSVKYSDYKYQIEITSNEESEGEIPNRRTSIRSKSESEAETDEEETQQAEGDRLPRTASVKSTDHSTSGDDELSDEEEDHSEKDLDEEEQSHKESEEEDHSEDSEDEEPEEERYDKKELLSEDESLKEDEQTPKGQDKEDKVSDEESDGGSHSEDKSQKVQSDESENEQELDYGSEKEFEDIEKSADELLSENEDLSPTQDRLLSNDEQRTATEDLPADQLSSDELPDFSADEDELEKTPEASSDLLTDRPHNEQLSAEDDQSVKEEELESNQILDKYPNGSPVESNVST